MVVHRHPAVPSGPPLSSGEKSKYYVKIKFHAQEPILFGETVKLNNQI